MTTKKLLTGIASATVLGALMLPLASFAQGFDPGLQYGAYTGLSGGDVRVTIANIVKTAMGLLGIIAVLIVLYGGFKWMTAFGNDTAIKEAKNILIAGVIGLVIIVSAYAIASFVITNLLAAAANGN